MEISVTVPKLVKGVKTDNIGGKRADQQIS